MGEDARRAVAMCGKSRNDNKNVSTLVVLRMGLAASFVAAISIVSVTVAPEG